VGNSTLSFPPTTPHGFILLRLLLQARKPPCPRPPTYCPSMFMSSPKMTPPSIVTLSPYPTLFLAPRVVFAFSSPFFTLFNTRSCPFFPSFRDLRAITPSLKAHSSSAVRKLLPLFFILTLGDSSPLPLLPPCRYPPHPVHLQLISMFYREAVFLMLS